MLCAESRDGFIGICKHGRSGALIISVCLLPGTMAVAEVGGRATTHFHLMWGRYLSQLLFPLLLVCTSAVVPPHDSGVLSCSFCRAYRFLVASLYYHTSAS